MMPDIECLAVTTEILRIWSLPATATATALHCHCHYTATATASATKFAYGTATAAVAALHCGVVCSGTCASICIEAAKTKYDLKVSNRSEKNFGGFYDILRSFDPKKT